MFKVKIRYSGIILLFLLGCDPFESRLAQTEQHIANVDAKAKTITRRYEPNIREIRPYQTYHYQSELTDPFRTRAFLRREEEKKQLVIEKAQKKRCLPPQCVPPEPHTKQLLEGYSLGALKFVGTLNENNVLVALVQTPDYGVVTAKIGDYMGPKNGKIQMIKESAIILQEKIEQNGLWKNKKTVLRAIQ